MKLFNRGVILLTFFCASSMAAVASYQTGKSPVYHENKPDTYTVSYQTQKKQYHPTQINDITLIIPFYPSGWGGRQRYYPGHRYRRNYYPGMVYPAYYSTIRDDYYLKDQYLNCESMPPLSEDCLDLDVK